MPKAKAKKKLSARKISAKFVKIIQGIPGYDPIATAGDCYFDEKAAQKALDFYPECLTHIKGKLAGSNFELEPFQQAVIANVFGWKKPDGLRRYREVVFLVPRKNGKTTLAAGVGIQLLFLDHEPGAEIYCAAADRDQASLVFDLIRKMVLNEPELSNRAEVFTKSVLYVPPGGSMGCLKPISSDAHSKHGYNSHGIIFDELHTQPNRDLNDVLATSIGSREQPLIFYITTQDFERPSICNEKVDYARDVRDGIIDDVSFLPVLYEPAEGDDWEDPEVWKKVNPNLGISISMEYFEREFKRAKNTPTFQNTFKRLHLNIRTAQDVRFLSTELWRKCGIDVDDAVFINDLRGQRCFAGLDMSSTIDLSSLVLLFPDAGNTVFPFFWIPSERAVEREKTDRVPYLTWANQGHIEMTEGNVVDYDVIRKRINELNEVFEITEIAIDRWNTTQLQTQLGDDGFEVIQFGQGYASMSAPTKELERLIISKDIKQDNNPVMLWNINNVMATEDAAGNLKPDKGKSKEKIDGVVALIMALGRSIINEGEQISKYETEGLTIL